MKKIIIIAIAVAVVVGLGIKGKSLLKTRQAQIANEPLPTVQTISVSVVKPTQGTLQNSESYLAKIASDKSINLSTKLPGYIEKIFVQESQSVKKGETLVEIDDTELLSNIQALKSTLSMQIADAKVAQSIYNRNIKLYKVGGVSKEKLEISKVTMEAKQSVVENTRQKIVQLQHQRSYLKIVAPFDGEIDKLLLHEGDLAATGKPIISMNNGVKKLLFSYAQTTSKIRVGLVVLLNAKEIGNVKSIQTTSSNGLTTAEVKVTKKLDLPIESSVNIDVITQIATGCLLPSSTLLHKKDGVFVMAYKDSKFYPIKIDVKMSDKNKVLVSPCPNTAVAKASEVKLAGLPAYAKVEIVGAKDE
jgi:RND family efflux transporter MFP subunit